MKVISYYDNKYFYLLFYFTHLNLVKFIYQNYKDNECVVLVLFMWIY